MNPQKLVASLELSQEYARLMKEKGRELPECYFWWIYVVSSSVDKGEKIATRKEGWILSRAPWENKKNSIPALTSGELGELLPIYISSEKHSNDWRCGFLNNEIMKDVPVISSNTEADARQRMLNYLLANDLV